jgi:heme-degrading monooxygenase HmoA
MHAVVVKVTVKDPEASVQELRERVVPGVSQAPGFVTGYWTRKGDNTGLSMVIFDSEEAANGMSERIASIVPDTVTLESVEVREVVANA